MEEKNYCLLILGDTLGADMDVEYISVSPPNILDAKGIMITTFVSTLSVKDISGFLKTNKRNFLLFELNEETSAFNIIKKNVSNGLFGFLNKIDDNNKKEDSENKTKLEELLNDALSKEEYEKAAQLRDLINKQNNP